MSLQTDTVFIKALSGNAELMAQIGATADSLPRLYGTAIPLPDEDADNVPVPYVIVTFDGLTNDAQTKDDPYEGDEDSVNIGVTVVARNLNELHELTQTVRDTILQYMRNHETEVDDYQMTASAIQYDSWKPCYWQTLNYQCDTNRDNNGEY